MAFNAALARCSGVAHSGGRFLARVILSSSFWYRSDCPSCFIRSSIAYARTGLVEKLGTRALRHRPALSCFLPTISPSCWWTFFQPKTFCAVRISSCGPDGILSGVLIAIYCSLPQTCQTDSRRLIRDRQRRQILNWLRHHKNEDPSAIKLIIISFWSIASRLASNRKFFMIITKRPAAHPHPSFFVA